MRWKGKGQRPNRLTHRLRPWISQSQKQRHPTPLRTPREGAPPGLEAEQKKTPRQQRRQGKNEPIPAERASVPAELQKNSRRSYRGSISPGSRLLKLRAWGRPEAAIEGGKSSSRIRPQRDNPYRGWQNRPPLYRPAPTAQQGASERPTTSRYTRHQRVGVGGFSPHTPIRIERVNCKKP